MKNLRIDRPVLRRMAQAGKVMLIIAQAKAARQTRETAYNRVTLTSL